MKTAAPDEPFCRGIRQPADLLFGAYRRDALVLLLMHPELSLHVREIARMTGKAPGTMLRELDRLAQADVLLRKPVGNQAHFQANGLCPIHQDLRSVLRKTAGVADVLRVSFEPLADRIRAAFIYGWVARGDERAGTDLDVMIIGDVGFGDIIEAFSSAHATLLREINPAIYPPDEFAAKFHEGEPFLRRVIADSRIFLIGTDDDLGQLASHRQTQATRRKQGRSRAPHGRGESRVDGRKRKRA